MNKLTSLISRIPKRTAALVSIVALAVIVPSAAFAWGPSRPTFTTQAPATYVTFDSITNNPVQGDERNFMQVAEANPATSPYVDSISLTAGHQYVVYMYYHNDASSDLNASGVGVATGAYIKAQIPAIVPSGSTGTDAEGYIGAANANPGEVYDEVSFSNATGGDIALRYIPGSATIHNLGKTNGMTMPDSIVTTGTPLGYDSLNGVVPGCNQYAGYVTFRVEADQANFTVNKFVRVAGTTTWQKSVTANPGATVQYEIEYQNTGNTEQNNVNVKDTLPAHETYVAGSTLLKNAANPNAKTVTDDLTTTGINIGDYTAGSNAYLMFNAKIDDEGNLVCGANLLHNVATVTTNNGSKTDYADVTVNRNCTVPGCTQNCTVTPPLLPHTGPSENIVAFLGLGALIAGIVYYVRSRRLASSL